MKLVQFKRRAEALKVEGETFEKLDLRSMKSFGSTWTQSGFFECNMDLADMRASKFVKCVFEKCSLRLAMFNTSFFEECLFKDCDIEGGTFAGSHFRDSGFRNCRMAYSETLFQDATMKGLMRFNGCNFHGSNLDFREVEPKSMFIADCNLWAAKLSMGCAIWNASFDDRAVRQFLALVARVSQDPRIAELAGEEYRIVCRAMDGRKGDIQDSTTSPQITSTSIQSYTGLMDSTVSATTIPLGTTTREIKT